MKRRIILDTGPLVAFLNSQDKYHDWTKAQWAEIRPPLLTCEAVISEACFLLRGFHKGPSSVLELLKRKVLKISFSMEDQIAAISLFMNKYRSLPASLADACLVRIAELHESSTVLTLDSDFRIYRMHKRRVIPLLTPPDIT
ncbi:type II toxin-antitoxin system VapC family toxin [Desulfoferrobacter suflitae]|uniref:type II toxin-antitoxin system VapC family toxin n=1 Tax=Desulfoferrobacter suflitae TaxID=2865782 RepID=UPI0021642462|nr:PIN domain-containing protein [Desulfoferrobacter suflitae]MCK8600508.1 PIN domain-containing protein [Desulfoferrobacter suflitae]